MEAKNQKPQWHFHQHSMGEPECTPLTEEFFKGATRLESVIREGVQNSIDAKQKNAKSVHVRIYYSGDEKALPAAKYEKYRLGAEDRYADAGSGLVSPPSVTEDCRYLVIEDSFTTGLTGDVNCRPLKDESDPLKCNYYKYFFKVNDTGASGKNSGDTLGSWGTGKATFPRASRLKTTFALSVREVGEPKVFLAGKATLQVHTDDKQVTWDPDGWFGYEVEIDKNDPNYSRALPKRPVVVQEKNDLISQFVKDFNLKRGEKTGTSIVIPHLVVEESEDGNEKGTYGLKSLIHAVLCNFLTAILDGTLTVEVSTGDGKDAVVIDAGSVGKFTNFLPTQADEDSVVTRVHYSMIREAIVKDIPKSRTFDLALVGKDQRPEWGSTGRFNGIDLPSVKKTLREGKSMLFNVPMSVLEKEVKGDKELKCPKEDSFQVILRKADLGRATKPTFYRLGLWIDGVAVQTVPDGYAAAVLIGHGPLAKVLVASEPPSHTEWDKNADKIKKICYNAKDHIQFVTTAAKEILEAIDNSDKEADWDPLSEAFGIPEEVPLDKDGKGKNKAKKDTQKNSGEDDGDKHGVPDPILNIEKVDESGRRGFAISVEPARVVEQGYPCSATYQFGFVPFSETGWSKYDFVLNDPKQITIEVDPPEAVGSVVEVEPKDNRLTVKLLKQGGVRISVTGFGKDRDLDWKKSGYTYGKEED